LAVCVGSQTAAAANDAGCQVDNIGGTAFELIEYVKATYSDTPFLHIRGAHSRGEISNNLARAGLNVREIVTYDQVVTEWSDAMKRAIDCANQPIFPIFSPRTCRLLIAELAKIDVVGHFVCISEAASSPLKTLKTGSVTIASHPSRSAMVQTVAAVWRDIKGG